MGPDARFSVRLLSKTPETGRSLRYGKSETGPCTSPDGSFLPIRTYAVTHSQKKDLISQPIGESSMQIPIPRNGISFNDPDSHSGHHPNDQLGGHRVVDEACSFFIFIYFLPQEDIALRTGKTDLPNSVRR